MAVDIRTYILGSLSPINVMQVFDLLGMDFIGPFKVSSAGSKFILNVVDYFSRYMIPTFTVSNGTDDVIQALSRIFQTFTTPGAFDLDRGSHFDNQKLRDLLSSRNVVVVYAPSSAHKSVGQIEKVNDILQKAFKRMQLPDEEWDKAVIRAIPSANERLVEGMRFTLAEVLLGFHSYPPVRGVNAPLRGDQTRTLYSHLPTPNDKVNLSKIIEYLSTKERIKKEAFEKSVESKECRKRR